MLQDNLKVRGLQLKDDLEVIETKYGDLDKIELILELRTKDKRLVDLYRIKDTHLLLCDNDYRMFLECYDEETLKMKSSNYSKECLMISAYGLKDIFLKHYFIDRDVYVAINKLDENGNTICSIFPLYANNTSTSIMISKNSEKFMVISVHEDDENYFKYPSKNTMSVVEQKVYTYFRKNDNERGDIYWGEDKKEELPELTENQSE